mmetsp:Transcript_20602/g.78953  ORF Transcript_20602/g.78953 Transcript_20602/m.78953 type:complete len:853 (+) Transcript_20602:213-2771(+)
MALALKENSSLTSLKLRMNGIKRSHLAAFQELLKSNLWLATSRASQGYESEERSAAVSKGLDCSNAAREEAGEETAVEQRTRKATADEERRAADASKQVGAVLAAQVQATRVAADAEEEEALGQARAALEQALTAVAYFRHREEESEEEERRTAAAMDQAQELEAAEAAHAQWQLAITTVEDSKVEEAVRRRDVERDRLLNAGAAAEGAGEVIQQYLRTLERRRDAAAATLENLRCGGKKEKPTRRSVDEEYVAGVEELIGRVQTAAEAAHSAVTGIRREKLKRVEEWVADTAAIDEKERTRRKAALETSRTLVAELAGATCLLRSAAAETSAIAAAQCADGLGMIKMEEAAIRKQLDAYTKAMAVIPVLRQSRCPAMEPLHHAEKMEALAQEEWSIAAADFDVAQKRMNSARAKDSPRPEREKAVIKAAKRELKSEEARAERRAATARVHKEAVRLLHASRLYPELVRRSARLAELQAAPTLVQGRCREDYTVIETLATGEGGSRHQVLICTRPRGDGDPVGVSEVKCVLKRYRLGGGRESAGSGGRRALLRELRLLEKVRHPCVAAARAVFFSADGSDAYIELEHFGGKDLGHWLAVQRRGATAAQRLLRQAAHGLAAVHEQDVVHGDVKPANVFVDGRGVRCVLGDFDIARAVSPTATTTATLVGGTAGYLAPERRLNPALQPTKASDVYSFGCVLLTALFPPDGGDEAEAGGERQLLLREDLSVVVPQHPNKLLRKLLEDMLAPQPEDRPSAKAVARHPYFREEARDEEAEAELWEAPRTCAVAGRCADREEALTRVDGLECSGASASAAHFVCREDLERMAVEAGVALGDGEELVCPRRGCAGILLP